ncbi:MAG: hypothetical protein FWC24_00005, partial [Treponema sp.]|nr:hypothetical protein [Treponema sp.]
MNEFKAASAKAEEARKRAGDFGSHDYFPGEWEAAEALYAAAGQNPQDTESGIREAIAAYNAAANAYDSAFMLTIPLYAQAREDEITELRNALIAAGARKDFPEFLTPADEAAVATLEQFEVNDYYAAKESADKALAMYRILTSAYNAWLVRAEIMEREFDVYDPDNFDSAGDILSEAMDAYKAGNFAFAQQNADESLQRYNLVLSNGWIAYAELRFLMADAERQAALDIKANIAVKDSFNEGEVVYEAGMGSFDSKKYEEAARFFINSEALFAIASTSAAEKRRRAAETMREADRKITESDEALRQAEIILEGEAQ